jgi:16S rRNA G966 N2-methylase RsmD
MRIIGGKFKGHRFNPPANNWPTRPTTDFAKEGLFNILNNSLDFSEEKMLDLFGGTGNHCYEFISRGCTDATYVDKHGPAVKFVNKIAAKLKIEDNIFAGPPYPLPTLDTIPDHIFKHDILRPGGWLIMEHNPNHNFEDHPRFFQARNYGTTIFAFFAKPKEGGDEEE